MTEPEYAIVGLIRKAQGVRGEVVVELLTNKPDVVFAPGSRVFAGDSEGNLTTPHDIRGEEAQTTLTIAGTKQFKNGLIVQFEELRDRDAAELWRGRYLLAPFSELQPLAADEVYLHDLIGLKIKDSSGKQLGEVTAFYELPQGVMLDVATARGSVVIPYRPEVILKTELDSRSAIINEGLGFFDDDDDAGGTR